MVTLAEIEAQAMDLTDTERAQLASKLLRSLPMQDDYEEEGIAEALRRREEMEHDPETIISWDQLRKAVGR
jgi:putative addiction module component (TIGR02574 family)